MTEKKDTGIPGDTCQQPLRTVEIGELLTFERSIKLKDVRAGDLVFRRSLIGGDLEDYESPFVSIFEPVQRIAYEIPLRTLPGDLQEVLPPRPSLKFVFDEEGKGKEFKDIGPFERWESLIIYKMTVDVFRLNHEGLAKYGVLPGYLYSVLEKAKETSSGSCQSEMLADRAVEVPSLSIQNQILKTSKPTMSFDYIKATSLHSGVPELKPSDISWGTTQYDVVNELLALVSEPQINVSEIDACLRKMWNEIGNGRMHKNAYGVLSRDAFPLYGDGEFLTGFYGRFEKTVGKMCSAIRVLFGTEETEQKGAAMQYKYAQTNLRNFGELIGSSMPTFCSINGPSCIKAVKPFSIFQLVASTPFSRVYDEREILKENLARGIKWSQNPDQANKTRGEDAKGRKEKALKLIDEYEKCNPSASKSACNKFVAKQMGRSERTIERYRQ